MIQITEDAGAQIVFLLKHPFQSTLLALFPIVKPLGIVTSQPYRSDPLKQEGRVAKLTTPLGPDVLVLVTFDAVEGLSELFEFRIDALNHDKNLDLDAIIGRSCSVAVQLYDAPLRHFTGVAVEAQALGMRDEAYLYRLVLRPPLWLLTRTTNCRIFHEKTALEIVKEVLAQRRIDVEPCTQRDYPVLNYCVQYRETDYAFVSRLMEQHGIYFFFKHAAGSCTLVLADSASSHQPTPKFEKVRFHTSHTHLHVREQTLVAWSSERRFRTGKVELRDYNFTKPNEDLKGQAQTSEKYEKAMQFEHYDYPGKHATKSDGEKYANVWLDAEQAADHRRFATGEAICLFPGALVTVTEHPVDAENKQYLVVRCTHHFATEAFRAVKSIPIAEQPYHGNFELAASDKVFRAPIVTPKPVMLGPQTAKVVARGKDKDSEEIDVDDDGYGLVKVRFHWDRDDKRSCWMRVAQMWAGPGWGGQFIPRIGMEVVVEFLEGDPDRPLVVGAVYNGNNHFPYAMPDNKTQSGLKSDSSKGHGGYNEFMFEDKKGEEKVRMHAQKDHDVEILNRETVKIGEKYSSGDASRETTLINGGDTLQLSNGSRKITVMKGSQSTAVDHDITLESTQCGTITIKTGASSITLSPEKIVLNSPEVQINGTMHVAIASLKIDLN
jgi:type VI secretion system secreted protein VgrG